MPKKRTTPISIRVARWAALAAAVTALGSMFSTVWTEKPWWIEAPAAHASADTPALSVEARPKFEATTNSFNEYSKAVSKKRHIEAPVELKVAPITSVDSEELLVEEIIVMAMSPASRSINYVKWIIPISTALIVGWSVMEYFHRRKKARTAE